MQVLSMSIMRHAFLLAENRKKWLILYGSEWILYNESTKNLCDRHILKFGWRRDKKWPCRKNKVD